MSETIDLSTAQLTYALDAADGLALTDYGRTTGPSWTAHAGASPLFALVCDGERIDGQHAGLHLVRVETSALAHAAQQATLVVEVRQLQVEIYVHTIVYPHTTLLQQWLTVHNTGQHRVRIERLDSIAFDLDVNAAQLTYFTSGWGAEFEQTETPLEGEMALETRAGRSSQTQHPWFALLRNDGEILSASVMWSGNWIFRFEPRGPGTYRLSGGLHDFAFFKDLDPGAAMQSPPVVVLLGHDGDLNTVSTQYGRVGRQFWYPTNDLVQQLPLEWNHWWSYEDKAINEQVFRHNVDVAAALGMDVCTLDAGWFGPTETGAHWYDYRGDWEQVNRLRFPNGIRALADYTHARGLKFGLWCEIEGLGKAANLAEVHPDFVARRDGERLGYVCFGNPVAQAWAYATLDRLIHEWGCDWIKLDFNVDPGAGCNCTDHGHGAGDGLYEHIQGYYRTLERIRARHPHVVLENCSSGGLRIDLGMLQHTHMTFLSDPDWPEHGLQLLWGATTMLAPSVCLYWGYSEWISDHPQQNFNPRDPALTAAQLDYYVTISHLGVSGLSQRLPDLPAWVHARLAMHMRRYRQQIVPFVRDADVYRLGPQPQRHGRGARWAAFQYALPANDSHLLFVFRLAGGEPAHTFSLRALQSDRHYQLTWLGEERTVQQSGPDLLQTGLRFEDLAEEACAVVRIDALADG